VGRALVRHTLIDLFYRSDLLRQAGFTAPADNWADWLRQLQAIKRIVGPQRYAVLLR